MGRVSHRQPLREIEVHPDTEPTKSLARCYGRFKCHSVCQECRTGQDAVTKRVQDSPVHVFCQSKIVRVYDQVFHGILSVVASSRVRGLSAICSGIDDGPDRKSTRLNSSHSQISYAVFCLKKKKKKMRKLVIKKKKKKKTKKQKK